MGACGYRAFENTCQKFTQRQLRASGGQRNEDDQRHYPPSDSTFLRVLQQLDAGAFATLVVGWLAEQGIGALARLSVDGRCCAAAAATMASPCNCSRPSPTTCA